GARIAAGALRAPAGVRSFRQPPHALRHQPSSVRPRRVRDDSRHIGQRAGVGGRGSAGAGRRCRAGGLGRSDRSRRGGRTPPPRLPPRHPTQRPPESGGVTGELSDSGWLIWAPPPAVRVRLTAGGGVSRKPSFLWCWPPVRRWPSSSPPVTITSA